ncbi:hypothetical protein BDY19DRAFT_427870 [Irpex rosettiformis]|uniref:Uncharacterized protein n=1 Tax=Irpex rosettiformis TaxID=378272 RepID=A0ACB8UGQ8_9APHY|nr:hypothetical protein BDY19DRAFT_427870 [Irpex rosettiformis]
MPSTTSILIALIAALATTTPVLSAPISQSEANALTRAYAARGNYESRALASRADAISRRDIDGLLQVIARAAASDHHSIIGSTRPNTRPHSRNVAMLGRQDFSDLNQGSEAFSLSGILKGIKGILGDKDKLSKIATAATVADIGSGLLAPGSSSSTTTIVQPAPAATQTAQVGRRDLLDLLVRANSVVDDSTSEAFSLSGLFNGIKSIFKDGDALAKAAKGASIASSVFDIGSNLGGQSASTSTVVVAAQPTTTVSARDIRSEVARHIAMQVVREMRKRSINELD